MTQTMSVMQIRYSEGGRPIKLGGDPVSIGRHPENTIRIKDDKASRRHCIIEPDGEGGFWLRDLESRNGTKLNGERIDRVKVEQGDVIRIGGLEFVVESGGSDAEVAGRKKTVPTWMKELAAVLKPLNPADNDEPKHLVSANGEKTDALAGGGEGPRALRLLLHISSVSRATDIHCEPKGEQVNVRMRVDGQMVWIVALPNRVGELVAGMIKTTCQMQAARRDAVLDGHFSTRYSDRRVEFRVSFTPSVHGQKMVMRVLDQRSVPHSIGDLGLAAYMEERIRRVCEQDHGLLLVCGPTGSGKTTTLYNALREIDRETRNVVTIEDPVEYQIDNVTQMPIDERSGNSFNSLLRSVLRQDPDVILVGEIRDEETARTAMQAAMTGHLVFSTVHAKDTIAAVFRLLDLKVEPYLVANSLNLVLAQRLVRVLCDHCKREVPLTPGQATRMGRFMSGKSKTYTAMGCTKCLKTGYSGRRALFELLDVNDDLRDVILTEPSIQAMKKVIEQGLFTTLAQYGYRLVAAGVAPIDEVDRVAGDG